MAHKLEDRDAQLLAEMMEHIECGKGYECAKSGFDNLGQVADVFGSGKNLMCLEDAGASCGYQIPYGQARVCNCPVRFYLHMHLDL